MTYPTVCATLGISLPIIQGPMTGSDTPALAAAVSAAGGLGMLGCGMRSPAAIAEAAAEVRRQTDQPFGLNLFVQGTPLPDPEALAKAQARLAPLYAKLGVAQNTPARWCEDFEAQWHAVLDARPAVASFTFGILSAAQVQALHAVGSKVIGTATTVSEAVAWAKVGADAVCASGMEAGGHRGTFLEDYAAAMVGTMALIPACVDALRPWGIPVIAAGGIMDGRGIAAAQALGAQAVQMGTAFLACDESGIGTAYRHALHNAQATDTRTTRVYSGRPARGIVNAMMQQLAPFETEVPPYPVQNALTGPLRKAAAEAGNSEYLSLWAGQGVAAARPMPAAALVGLLTREWLDAVNALRSA